MKGQIRPYPSIRLVRSSPKTSASTGSCGGRINQVSHAAIKRGSIPAMPGVTGTIRSCDRSTSLLAVRRDQKMPDKPILHGLVGDYFAAFSQA